jgi:ribose/xylose/arabinose/galactoside ABC-type transport system permease subunit
MNLRKHIPFVLDNLIWFMLLAVIVFFSILTHKFLTLPSLLNILVHAAVLGIMVIGQSFTLVTGNFDLSMESTLGLCALVGAWLIVPAGAPSYGGGVMFHPFVAVPIMLLIGLGIGWINGTLVTRFKMNNFVVTLAMLIALRGCMLILTEGHTVYGTPELFNVLGGGSIGPIPVLVVVVIVAYLIAHIVLKYTPFGRQLYAVGGNRNAALASGVDPDRRIRHVYLISGFLAAFAGWMLAGRLTNVINNLGENMIFEVFAAAVIGGISLQGGRGTMLGAFGGVLLLSAVNTGLNLMDVSPFWIESIRGLVILVAMLIEAQKVRYTAPIAAAARATQAAPSTGPA